MDRKKFLRNSIVSFAACCGASSTLLALNKGFSPISSTSKKENWVHDLEGRMIKGSETPDWKKVKKAERWIKDLMDNIDNLLDDDTKKTLMQACGKSCYNKAFGVAPPKKASPENAKKYISYLRQKGYKVTENKNKTTVIYNWGRDHQNPWGLIVSDGYCMCPLVENESVEVSGTFCNCSSGYIKESVERFTGKRVTVEVLDSLKRGGNDCVFKIEIFNH